MSAGSVFWRLASVRGKFESGHVSPSSISHLGATGTTCCCDRARFLSILAFEFPHRTHTISAQMPLSLLQRLDAYSKTVPSFCDLFASIPLPTQLPTLDWIQGQSQSLEDDPGWVTHLLIQGSLGNGDSEMVMGRVTLPCSSLQHEGIGGPDEELDGPGEEYQPYEPISTLPHDGDIDRVRCLSCANLMPGSSRCMCLKCPTP